ncbi:phosphoribosylaminoimidazolesuccinocarboxamide synthase [Candidatus Bathyarchaeota archaeon]|nr:phosphoribosylaminoimidazolesuccinocarboxamide synthase [Candidatus Bathyarchaeota archaeon]
MGSVKDLEVLRKPTKTKMGVGRFRFSDRYSVFDWGEMPDLIEGKGAALCLMGAYCFEKLEEKGVKTHYKGLVSNDGKKAKVSELQQPSNVMEIDLVNVYRPKAISKDGKLQYDYSAYTPSLTNCLVPLEVIYRNGLPEGSSIFRRLELGTVSIQQLGLDHYPKPGEKLAKPVFDVSTKLEDKDRYLTWDEAREIARLTVDEVENAKALLLQVDKLITQTAFKADLENEDGKIELAFNPERRLMIVDVVGTLDECRFTYNGLHVSKEIARQFYRKNRWYADVEEAKKRAEEKGISDWKSLCRTQPPRLDIRLKRIVSEMYMATANELTERRFFKVPSLAEVVNDYKAETHN